MRMDWRLVLGCLATCLVFVPACDDGAAVGGIGGPPGSSGTPGPGSSGNTPGPSNTAVLPPGVPEGAEIGEVTDWYGAPTATYATFEADGKTVKEFGTVMALASLANIPPGAFASYQWLKVPPSVAEQTFIKSYQLDFMPMGHPPAKVYDVPHIETHAFSWSVEEVSRLTCRETNDNALPAGEFIPDGVWNFDPMPGIPNCLPQMGVHGFDVQAPELNGARFTRSLSVLVARGEFMSYEPKATVEEMQKRKDFTIALPPPKKLANAAKLPTTFNATYVPAIDAYRLVYTNFVALGPS